MATKTVTYSGSGDAEAQYDFDDVTGNVLALRVIMPESANFTATLLANDGVTVLYQVPTPTGATQVAVSGLTVTLPGGGPSSDFIASAGTT